MALSLTLRTERNTDKSFRQLGFDIRVWNLLKQKSVIRPTPIQRAVIPFMGRSKDVLVRATKGSGKTLAYVLWMIDVRFGCFERDRYTSAPLLIIIVPTYDLGQQLVEEMAPLFKKMFRRRKAPKVSLLKRSILFQESRDLMKDVPDIVVSTVECVLSCLEQGFLKTEAGGKSLGFLVIDQIDEVMSDGFEDLKSLMVHVPQSCTRFLFSDNPSSDVDKVKPFFPRNPYIITEPEIGDVRVEIHDLNAEQYYIPCSEDYKGRHLLSLLYSSVDEKFLIITNSNGNSNFLRRFLDKKTISMQWKIGALNFTCNKASPDFESTLADALVQLNIFNDGKMKCLILDVKILLWLGSKIPRAIKLDDLDIMVHFDMPSSADEYRDRFSGISYNTVVSYSLVSNEEEMGVIKALKSSVGEDFGGNERILAKYNETSGAEGFYY